MAADVIEVDFEARRLAEPLEERLDDVSERIDDLRRALDWYAWVENQWDLERRHVGSLLRALRRERARNFPFTDDDVLRGLRAVYVGEPVRATAIVHHLDGREVTHSARVRVGLVLSRLNAAGHVAAVGPRVPSGAKRWTPAEAHDAE